jgi:hypothetical protein
MSCTLSSTRIESIMHAVTDPLMARKDDLMRCKGGHSTSPAMLAVCYDISRLILPSSGCCPDRLGWFVTAGQGQVGRWDPLR